MDEAAFERQLQLLLTHRAPPLSGWVLQMALKADEDTDYPVVVSLHKATDFRRSVVIAVLASLSLDDIRAAFDADDLSSAMQELFHANIRAVLRKAFGAVPGLATALGKMEGEPFDDPGHYDALLNLLQPDAAPDRRKRAMALRHAANVTSGVVCALERLDAEFVHPLLVELFDTETCADTANAILRYVQALSSTPVTQEDILIISKGMKDLILHEWAEKLLARKADRLPMGPLDDHPAFVALKDATAFSSLAKEYRNCLDTHVCRAAMGRAAFYTVTHLPYLIVELVRYHHSNREIWALKGIHNRANRRVSSRDKQDIEGLLRLRGITELTASNDPRLSPELVSVLSSGTTYGDGLY